MPVYLITSYSKKKIIFTNLSAINYSTFYPVICLFCR